MNQNYILVQDLPDIDFFDNQQKYYQNDLDLSKIDYEDIDKMKHRILELENELLIYKSNI